MNKVDNTQNIKRNKRMYTRRAGRKKKESKTRENRDDNDNEIFCDQRLVCCSKVPRNNRKKRELLNFFIIIIIFLYRGTQKFQCFGNIRGGLYTCRLVCIHNVLKKTKLHDVHPTSLL